MLPIALALAQFAPQIAGLFGGSKAESVASKVVEIAQTVTGHATPETALKAVQADPAVAMQFQKAVMDHETDLKRIALEETKAILEDGQDARAKFATDRGVFWLGVAVLLTFAGVVGMALYGSYKMLEGGITIKDAGIVAAIFGFLGTLVGYVAANAQQVIGYFFGSSKGSADNRKALADAVTQLGSAAK